VLQDGGSWARIPDMKSSYSLALVAIGATIWVGCQHHVDPPGTSDTPIVYESPCDPDVVYFEQDVLPLLVSSCGQSNCHDAISHEHGVLIESYTSIMSHNDLVEPGNPGSSELIEVLFETGEDLMPPPPNAPLTDAQINTLTTWIEQGALNLSCSDCDTSIVSFSGSIFPLISTGCVACHSGVSPDGGVDLTTYNNVVGAVSYSNLMASIRQDPGATAMPPAGNALSECEVRLFELWIEDGMPNN
jgi:hypothetical protein